MKIGVIGLGLIGGSLAMSLKKNGVASNIIGMDANEANAAKALELGIIDGIGSLNDVLMDSELIVLAIPVDKAMVVLAEALDNIPSGTVITDMGSTKA